MRPATNGPRSFTFTRTVFPFFSFLTSTTVPSGSVRCAAETFSGRNVSPEAVGSPSNSFPYHDASPRSTAPGVGVGGTYVFAFGVEEQPQTESPKSTRRIPLKVKRGGRRRRRHAATAAPGAAALFTF